MAAKKKAGRTAAAKPRAKGKRQSAKTQARQPKMKGERVEVYPTMRKQAGGEKRQEWAYRVIGKNGRKVGTSEESFKHKKYAIRRADKTYPTLPIFVAGEPVPNEERPSRIASPAATPAPEPGDVVADTLGTDSLEEVEEGRYDEADDED